MKRAGLTYRRPDKLTRYAEAVRHAGAEPVGLLAPGPPSLEGLDGLVITGGTGLDPALYGEPPHPLAEPPDRERDAMERRLLEEALARDLPVLAICRGHQLFHVVHGGSLIQHLDAVDRHSQKTAWDAHSVMVELKSCQLSAVGVQLLDECGEHALHLDSGLGQLLIVARLDQLQVFGQQQVILEFAR